MDFSAAAVEILERSRQCFNAGVMLFGGADAAEHAPSNQALASEIDAYTVARRAELVNEVCRIAMSP